MGGLAVAARINPTSIALKKNSPSSKRRNISRLIYRPHLGQPTDPITAIDLARYVVEERAAGERF